MEGGSNHLKESLPERPSQQKRAIDDGGNGSDWEREPEAGAKTGTSAAGSEGDDEGNTACSSCRKKRSEFITTEFTTVRRFIGTTCECNAWHPISMS